MASTALPSVCVNGHLETVQWLVQQGADVDIGEGEAFLAASANGHLGVVRYLIEKGANTNAYGSLAVIKAAKNSHLCVVRYLVEEKGGSSYTDYVKDMAMMRAVQKGHLLMVQYLVEEWKADVTHTFAIEEAMERGDLPMVHYLTEQGASVKCSRSICLTFIHRHYHVIEYLSKRFDLLSLVHSAYFEEVLQSSANVFFYMTRSVSETALTDMDLRPMDMFRAPMLMIVNMVKGRVGVDPREKSSGTWGDNPYYDPNLGMLVLSYVD